MPAANGSPLGSWSVEQDPVIDVGDLMSSGWHKLREESVLGLHLCPDLINCYVKIFGGSLRALLEFRDVRLQLADNVIDVGFGSDSGLRRFESVPGLVGPSLG